ncbi:MAG: hypothetical protein IPJ19_02385 [Planctomycetes bacterium]|nr:hypothetical protein [Planctomycetota bacterium]
MPSDLGAAERRCLMLLSALRSVDIALGGSGCAALFSPPGSALTTVDTHGVGGVLWIAGLLAGLVALAAHRSGGALDSWRESRAAECPGSLERVGAARGRGVHGDLRRLAAAGA